MATSSATTTSAANSKVQAKEVTYSIPAATRSVLTEIWSNVKCGELVKQQAPVIIDSGSSVADACKRLADAQVSSAPVYDRVNDCFTRLLDWTDISGVLLNFVKEGSRQEMLTDNNAALEALLEKVAVGIVPSQFHESCDLSRQRPFFAVRADDPLLSAVRMLSQRTTKTRVHRVVVLSSTPAEQNSKAEFKSILSQSDAVKYIASKLTVPEVKALTAHKLSEFRQLVSSDVASVSGATTVLDALSLLTRRRISSLAVISSNGDYIGAISFAEIKYLFRSHLFSGLRSTCAQFIQQRQKTSEEYDPMHDAVTPDSTLADVIRRMVGHHLRRVWVLQADSDRPVGVVSLTDVLNVLQ